MIISENDRCYEIRNKASKLLKVHNINTSTAIDIRELIASIGKPISIKVTDLKGITGFTCLNTKNNSYRMFFEENLICDCPARLNFTVAHELGHILLNHFTGIVNSLHMNYIMEREANLFVDELLMPTLKIYQYGMNAREIAETYNVSRTAAHNKIKYLKSNTLLAKLKADLEAEYLKEQQIRNSEYYDHNNRIVYLLHEAWLDPDRR